MYHDPCPNCGHRRKRTLMSTDPEASGIVGLWKGEGGPLMQALAKVGTTVLAFLFVLGLMVALHI